ncbi:MAG: gamma-glutamylcyclotransferase family protein, partial [Pseudohongiella sp.]|uniref:gamma-glutamylcyclotransferase n=1 Tax=Pseudohongiella sp. TaxID=1979412 RepID=UPI0034A09C56
VAVYGTLKRGLSNYHLLEDAEFMGNDILREITLYDLGPYPGAKAEFSQGIEVDVFSVTTLQLRQLDLLEDYLAESPDNGLYDRRMFQTRYGPAWVYLYNPPVSGLAPIATGGWQPRATDSQ